METRIFWNLTRKVWSVQIKIDGRFVTIGYADAAELESAVFYHSETARLRLLPKHAREVHAHVTGQLTAVCNFKSVEKYSTPELQAAIAAVECSAVVDLERSVSYRPFERAYFRIRDTLAIIESAKRVAFVANRCSVE